MRTPTIPSRVARAMLRPYYLFTFHHRVPWPVQRAVLDWAGRRFPLPAGTALRRIVLGGRPAERISVGPAAGPEAVLYVHGGGFTVGSLDTHRSLAAHLARDVRRPVYLVDYRLAPEHPFPAALEDTLAAFDALAGSCAHPAGSIALAGDSAGGGIALATAQVLAARGAERPAALVLISPWTDPNVAAERARDVVVNRKWGFACAAAYLGGGDSADPRYAPLLGALAGLPPTYLYTTERELLYAQCARLATRLREAGVELRYVESPALWHAAQAQAGLVKEAAESLRDIAGFLERNWSSATGPEPAGERRDGRAE
jgi:acetyl esterase/lipase